MDSASALFDLDQRRRQISAALNPKQRSALGQFLTPMCTARFMAGLLEFSVNKPAHLLDPGAGIGTLSAAAVQQWPSQQSGGIGLQLTCYELEASFLEPLEATLSTLSGIEHEIFREDFIEAAIKSRSRGERPYTHAILNPPYKKIQAVSRHRNLIRKLGLETSNLYACFLACTVSLSAPGAQVVAIIPRSWMNGLYFKPFRYWLFDHAALTHIHIFDRRDSAFADDGVLQENVIIKLLVGVPQNQVRVSASSDDTFADLTSREVSFDEIVTPGDAEMFVHVPTTNATDTQGLPGSPLREIGLDVCTGPVVDFRLREYLRQHAHPHDAPLLYSTHFTKGGFEWPTQGEKSNAIEVNDSTRRWLMPTGTYVVTRRLTSKEERRRVVAYLLTQDDLPDTPLIGFENHLNVYHHGKHGLDMELARGLCAYLNSQAVDDYFRTFSGHTQVNATDLRRLRYPSLQQLREMGRFHVQKGAGCVAHSVGNGDATGAAE